MVYPLDWSPDGRSIFAIRDRSLGNGGEAYEIIFISTTDGSVRFLKNIHAAPGGVAKSTYARLSPDGRFVAFASAGKGSPTHDDIFIMTADGRNEVVVAAHPAEDQVLAWAPDGKSFVFFSDRAGTWDIWSVPISEGKQQGEPELLKKDFGYNSEAAGFAPDGSLYYGTFTNSGGLYICEVDLETGKVPVPPAPVTTRYIGPPSQPSWSPDGKKLLYVSRAGADIPGNNILTIWSAATGEERFLSPRLRSVGALYWAPDGRSIIAPASTDTETAIFRIDIETSEISRLADEGQCPRLCPDGKTLVFVKGGNIIMKRNLDTGEVSEVAKAGVLYYDLSPDGRQVVFQVNGAVKIVSLNGGEPRELFRGLAQVYRLRWTRDGRYIIAEAIYTENRQFWRVPAQGGAPLKLDLSIPKIGDSFTLNPDNRRFAYSIIETPKIELWVMENFLPQPKVVK